MMWRKDAAPLQNDEVPIPRAANGMPRFDGIFCSLASLRVWADAMLKKVQPLSEIGPRSPSNRQECRFTCRDLGQIQCLILFYEPGNDQGIGAIQSRCNAIGLPNNLWLDVRRQRVERQGPEGHGRKTPCSTCTTTSRHVFG